MKTYDQLTDDQKAVAVERATSELLKAILEGMRFNDKLNGDDFQTRIDAALAEADRMQTPWFAGEYIMDTCRNDIESMARCNAEDSLYAEPGECVIDGVL